MLKLTKDWLLNDGFVYLEVPDGEMASRNGKDRGEFYIDHFHIFSIASVSIMANKSGYCIQNIYRLKEPSDKFTIRAFLSKIWFTNTLDIGDLILRKRVTINHWNII